MSDLFALLLAGAVLVVPVFCAWIIVQRLARRQTKRSGEPRDNHGAGTGA